MQPEMPIELYVHPTKGDDTYPGNSLYPFRTLTRALQEATPGTLIQLSRGTYSEATGERFPLVLIDGVALTGNLPGQGGGVVIEGGGRYRSGSFGDQIVAIVLLGSAELRGVTVSTPVEKGTGVWVESGAPTIAGCTLSRCGREGMLVGGTANPMVSNCVFQENQSCGLTLVRQARGEIRNSLWRQNQFGMAISDQAAPLIISNQYLENQSGMVLSGAAAPILRGNIFTQNRQVGLAVFGFARPDLGQPADPGGNRFRDNPLDLRNAADQPVRLSGNQLNPAHTQGAIEFLTIRSPLMLPLLPLVPADAGVEPTETTLDPDEAVAALPDPTTIAMHALIDRGYIPAAVSQTAPTDRISIGEWQQWLQQAELEAADAILSVDSPLEPALPLTHLQAITSLVTGLPLKPGRPEQLIGYRDRAQVPSAQVQRVATALRHQLLAVPPADPAQDRLNLQVQLTPIQAAGLLHRALVLLGKLPSLTLPDQAELSTIQRLPRLPQLTSTAPARPITVILDPGHGGSDTGVVTRPEAAETGATLSPDQPLSSPLLTSAPELAELAELEAASSPLLPRSPVRNAPRLPQEAPPPGMPEMRLPGDPPTPPSLTEKTIVLSVGQAIAGFLQQQGLQVVLTRSSDDQNPSLAERLALIEQHQAAIFVSLHANASIARQSSINGLETYYNPDSIEGSRLAWAIHKTLTRMPDFLDQGVHPGTFYTLRTATVPAVHLEVGYITGDKDAASLANLAYHRYLGRSIANGILRYVRQTQR